ncbi:hypothetical protein ACFCX4_31785 [Kitasatospora sp. NPDC056327]|uniref:hypothetical protein n=1 Tax=Kitasatospora sp. NPDC056327 TaxID=3345785 RepID=UPI0035DA31A5
MTEIDTSNAVPSDETVTPEAGTTLTAGAEEAVAAAAAGIAEHVVPADEKHEEPQELFGGEVDEPEHAEGEPGGTVPLGAINAHP